MRTSRMSRPAALALTFAVAAAAQAQDEHWSRQFKKPQSTQKMGPDTGMSDGGGKARVKTVKVHDGRVWMCGAWEPGISAEDLTKRQPNEYWHLWAYSEDHGWEVQAWFHSAQGGSGPDGVINDFLWLPDGRLVVGGEFTRLDNPGGTRYHNVNALAVYDPKEPTADKWKPLGTFQYNGTVSSGGAIYCLAYDEKAKHLYLGGTFGGIPGRRGEIPSVSPFIHRYSFERGVYEPLIPGVGGQKPAIRKIIVDNSTSPATIYIAGKFHYVGGNGLNPEVSASTAQYSTGFASWQEGKGWKAWPEEHPEDGSGGAEKGILDRAGDYMFFDSVNVHDALVDGEDIWIVGSFSNGQGKEPLRGVAKWDKAKKAWVDPTGKGGFGRECFSIAKGENGKLYFAGAFGGRRGVSEFIEGFKNGDKAHMVCSYDPKSGEWAQLGSGLSGRVFPEAHLAVSGNDVYVVGDFNYIGAERTGKDKKADAEFESWYIARWNETIDFTKAPPKLAKGNTWTLRPAAATKPLSTGNEHWSRAYPKPPRAVGRNSSMSAKTGMDDGTGTPDISAITKQGEVLYFTGSWAASMNERWYVWKLDPKEGWVKLAWSGKGGEETGPSSPPEGMAWHDGKLYVHGAISNVKGLAVYDPASGEWTPFKGKFGGKEVMGHGTEQGGGPINDIAWDSKTGDMYLVGTAGCVTNPDGKHPTDVGQVIRVDKDGNYHHMGHMLKPENPGKPVLRVSCIALDESTTPTGIYIGGTFNYYGETPTTNKRMCYNVARWDYEAKDWRPVGKGVTIGLSELDKGSYPEGLPGLPECPGRYQGFLGTGFPYIRDLICDAEGNLYAGGTLGLVDNDLDVGKRDETFGIARWNKATDRWESCTKVDGVARDVVQMSWLKDGRLLLTGAFNCDNGWNPVQNVAALDTKTGELSSFGGGLMRSNKEGVIGAMVVHCVDGDDIYFAGLFDYAGINADDPVAAPISSHYVARWSCTENLDPNKGLVVEPVEALEAPSGFSSKSFKVELKAKLTEGEGEILWFERRSNGDFAQKAKGEAYSANIRLRGGDGDQFVYVCVKRPDGSEGGKMPVRIPVK